MQIISKKAEVLNLKADLKKLKLNIGDELSLQFDDAGCCHVLCTPKKTWLGQLFINRRSVRLGHLSQNDALYLAKKVKDASKARVRVVDAIPKHLSVANKDSVYISVWLKK
jgi:hypothetical protein